ncbi:hypothetical protein CHS0354_015597 [Potamilus streckersoni]|uniref:Voltage-gated hydrogen channel 1 n=1 Tax=Potamilus streckersoni TaxID=2493646 RepID=A0AAE0W9V8_9BIVA|nr:hypothetical protein CHS0354_015597 [Potamilus streckersoni]
MYIQLLAYKASSILFREKQFYFIQTMLSPKLCVLVLKCCCRRQLNLCLSYRQKMARKSSTESRDPHPRRSIEILADRTIQFAHAQACQKLSKAEQKLEIELAIESQDPPDSKIGRFRHHGRRVLHSKHVLLMVVILNIVDCLLVLGELMLDIHYMKDLVEESRTTTEKFFKAMHNKYPVHLMESDSMHVMYEKIVQANCVWKPIPDFSNNSEHVIYKHPSSIFYSGNKKSMQNGTDVDREKFIFTGSKFDLHRHHLLRDSLLGSETHTKLARDRRKRRVNMEGNHKTVSLDSIFIENNNNWDNDLVTKATKLDDERVEMVEEHGNDKVADRRERDTAGALHKTSIIILGVLFLETILKVVCMGRLILSHKFEFFDGIIVICSFVLDLVFIKDLTSYQIEDFVFILTFLIPWRVIRVANSLIVSVRDHEHFQIKLIYKQKKNATSQLRQNKIKEAALQNYIERLEKILECEGISQWKIQRIKAVFLRVGCPKFNVLGSFATLAFGSVMDGLEAFGKSENGNNNDTDGFEISSLRQSGTKVHFETSSLSKSLTTLSSPTSARVREFLLPLPDQTMISPPPSEIAMETVFSYRSDSEEVESNTDSQNDRASIASKPRITVSEV